MTTDAFVYISLQQEDNDIQMKKNEEKYGGKVMRETTRVIISEWEAYTDKNTANAPANKVNYQSTAATQTQTVWQTVFCRWPLGAPCGQMTLFFSSVLAQDSSVHSSSVQSRLLLISFMLWLALSLSLLCNYYFFLFLLNLLLEARG